VALSGPVDFAHRSNPINDSERLLFRHYAFALVRLDCLGQVHPGLAESWQRGPDRGEWTFTLREGVPVGGLEPTADDVVRSFKLPDARAVGIDSVAYLDDHHVRVRVRDLQDSIPRLFADPALAVMPNIAWEGMPSKRVVIPASGDRPTIDFQLVEHGDLRDAIDRGIDLAVTRDPAVVEYVAGRSEIETYPLPWSLTHVLLQPPGAQSIPVVTDSVRSSLARDAVQAEARPSEPPYWWDGFSACPGGTNSEEQHLTASRIVYPRGDEVARGLAERLVALAGTAAALRAAALDPADFSAAMRDRTERAYVVGAPRASLAPCRDASAWPSGASIQPLIDTRARALVRRGSPALTVDWDGTVRVLP
jgi:hypothetical protein